MNINFDENHICCEKLMCLSRLKSFSHMCTFVALRFAPYEVSQYRYQNYLISFADISVKLKSEYQKYLKCNDT